MNATPSITQQTLNQWLNEAVEKHQQGDIAAATAGYQRILQHAPQHFNAIHLLGVAALQQEQYQRAFELIQSAIQVHPTSREARRNFAMALMHIGQTTQAIDQLTALLQQDHSDLHARGQRRELYWSTGQLESALQDDLLMLKQQPELS